jgi:hypothetical protein
MTEREAMACFHDWRAARHRKAETRRRSRCIRLALPLSIGLAAFALAQLL